MKQTVWTKFLNWILATLGFAAATACQPKPAPLMYGQPFMSYEVSGKVVDEEMNPIEGIQVVGVERDTTFTAADGSFFVSSKDWDDNPVALFKDIDGPENGGEFKDKVEYFDWSKFEKVEEGNRWYRGKYVGKDFVVKMEKKTEE